MRYFAIFAIIFSYYQINAGFGDDVVKEQRVARELVLDINSRNDDKYFNVKLGSGESKNEVKFSPSKKAKFDKVVDGEQTIWKPKTGKKGADELIVYLQLSTKKSILAKVNLKSGLSTKSYYYINYRGRWIWIDVNPFEINCKRLKMGLYSEETAVIENPDDITVDIGGDNDWLCKKVFTNFKQVYRYSFTANEGKNIVRVVDEDGIICEHLVEHITAVNVYYDVYTNIPLFMSTSQNKSKGNHYDFYRKTQCGWNTIDENTYYTTLEKLERGLLMIEDGQVVEAPQQIQQTGNYDYYPSYSNNYYHQHHYNGYHHPPYYQWQEQLMSTPSHVIPEYGERNSISKPQVQRQEREKVESKGGTAPKVEGEKVDAKLPAATEQAPEDDKEPTSLSCKADSKDNVGNFDKPSVLCPKLHSNIKIQEPSTTEMNKYTAEHGSDINLGKGEEAVKLPDVTTHEFDISKQGQQVSDPQISSAPRISGISKPDESPDSESPEGLPRSLDISTVSISAQEKNKGDNIVDKMKGRAANHPSLIPEVSTNVVNPPVELESKSHITEKGQNINPQMGGYQGQQYSHDRNSPQNGSKTPSILREPIYSPTLHQRGIVCDKKSNVKRSHATSIPSPLNIMYIEQYYLNTSENPENNSLIHEYTPKSGCKSYLIVVDNQCIWESTSISTHCTLLRFSMKNGITVLELTIFNEKSSNTRHIYFVKHDTWTKISENVFNLIKFKWERNETVDIHRFLSDEDSTVDEHEDSKPSHARMVILDVNKRADTKYYNVIWSPGQVAARCDYIPKDGYVIRKVVDGDSVIWDHRIEDCITVTSIVKDGSVSLISLIFGNKECLYFFKWNDRWIDIDERLFVTLYNKLEGGTYAGNMNNPHEPLDIAQLSLDTEVHKNFRGNEILKEINVDINNINDKKYYTVDKNEGENTVYFIYTPNEGFRFKNICDGQILIHNCGYSYTRIIVSANLENDCILMKIIENDNVYFQRINDKWRRIDEQCYINKINH